MIASASTIPKPYLLLPLSSPSSPSHRGNFELIDRCRVDSPIEVEEGFRALMALPGDEVDKVVNPGDTIFIGQYLFTGCETTSVWLEVTELKEDDVLCIIKNFATLAGSLFTLHISQIHINLPTLSDSDKDLSTLLSDIGLNIREAHVFSTTDGYSLDVFVVDGWPIEVRR
uniref:ACT domain-containing protein n=1 Tax=Ananas comosus var. bracteatus TaxID=296719 RepID=A0A6V7PGP0_ANACO|nr:unnamed protein product [Ananas comosus var. bracteatus]